LVHIYLNYNTISQLVTPKCLYNIEQINVEFRYRVIINLDHNIIIINYLILYIIKSIKMFDKIKSTIS
jgi:hypothetical protein